ncbi:hypothetical protein MC885_017970 [Smutsia gigantea]|nr:hypothetical protein MC885_017970 [Smutsia gigantea]
MGLWAGRAAPTAARDWKQAQPRGDARPASLKPSVAPGARAHARPWLSLLAPSSTPHLVPTVSCCGLLEFPTFSPTFPSLLPAPMESREAGCGTDAGASLPPPHARLQGPRPGPRQGGAEVRAAHSLTSSDRSSSLGLVLRKWKTVSQAPARLQNRPERSRPGWTEGLRDEHPVGRVRLPAAVSDTRFCPPAACLPGISRSRDLPGQVISCLQSCSHSQGQDGAEGVSIPAVPGRSFTGDQRHQAGPEELVGPEPATFWWRGLLAARAWLRASGEELGSGFRGS